MRRHFMLGWIGLLALAVAGRSATRAAEGSKADAAPKGEVVHYKFSDSKIFPGTVRDYAIYVPKQYDPTKPACLWVCQDGVQFNAPAVFDELIAKKEMPVTIGVFVSPGIVAATSDKALPRFNRSFEYDGLGDNYAQFLIDELLPAVEKQKTSDGRPIHLSKDGNDRAIGGASSGAICAFTAAWERPDSFHRVFSAVGTYVGLRGGNEYPTLIRKYEPKPIRVFLQDGSADQNIYLGDWWMANQEMERALKFAGYEVEHAWGTGGHNSEHATKIFADAMRWLWKDWPTPVKAGRGSPQLQDVLLQDEPWKVVKSFEGLDITSEAAVNAEGEVFFQYDAIPMLPAKATRATYKIAVSGEVSQTANYGTFGPIVFGPNGRRYGINWSRATIVAHDMDGKSQTVSENLQCRQLVAPHDGGLCMISAGALEDDMWHISRAGDKKIVGHIPSARAIALSPDQSLLYVADETHWIHSFQIQADGSLVGGQRYFHLHSPDTDAGAGAEGMCVDRDGRLYVGSALGIQICNPTGWVNCIVPMPQAGPNQFVYGICLGGASFDTMFVTCGRTVYSRKVKTHGVYGFMEPTKPVPHL